MGENFISWINVLLNSQQYFNLEKGACQGDPILPYLFILPLEVLFELIKNNADMRWITIFNHAFMYTAFADDSTFFLNDLLSVKNLIDTFRVFYRFSVLKANLSNCWTRFSERGFQPVCGLKSIYLTADTIKILGVHF